MRQKRHKKNRKCLQFYRTHFGYREPYRVVVDGTLLRAVVDGPRPLDVLLRDVLDAERVTPVVTRCIMLELSRMIRERDRLEQGRSDELRRASRVARALRLERCGHEVGEWEKSEWSGARCVMDLVERRREQLKQPAEVRTLAPLVVASVDSALQDQLRALPGVLLVRLITGHGRFYLEIEEPPSVCRDAVQRQAYRQRRAPLSELEAAAEAAAEQRQRRRAGAPVDFATMRSAADDIAPAARSRERARCSRATAATTTKLWMDVRTDAMRSQKRRRAKGPNPLSVKKKKKQHGEPA
ncbi:hypothetical protein CDCA_CDCA09G2693 [Cyanidium caldarium]|uniref:UTP23 sensor motif region domain-containing protein n=1 Tax=Cyanidium caldarium TaxID=2771 RepID=A0AAV9IWJ8_CYACA|nr:hypothetical protein CDCA_CDCA09G2693 [Cyanidium caldarium]|eukprot:ctg_390.g208